MQRTVILEINALAARLMFNFPGFYRFSAEGTAFGAYISDQHLLQTGLAGTVSTRHGHRLIHQLLAVTKWG